MGTLFETNKKTNPMRERILFVQLYMGLIFIMSGEAASCPIKMSQHRVVVKHGDPVSVNCSTSESNFSGIGWEASRGGTGIRPVNHLLWTVNSLTEWSMSPVCFFSQHPGDVCMRELEVIVYRFPETIEISSSSAYSNLMSEGETHNFTCHIPKIAPLQDLTVRWYKGDTVLQTDTLHSDTREPLNSSSVFSFTATKEDHGARFRCEAHMDLGPEGPQFNATSHELIANVEYGPYIECPTIELREGESLKGKCIVMGNPTPEVIWFKDGQWINLTTPLRRNDGGIYTVKAEGFSSAEETIQVNVLYGPVMTCPDRLDLIENTPIELICTRGFPTPKEIWYKDDEEVELPKIFTKNEEGLYWVNASNAHSSVNSSVEIIVLYPPSPIRDLEDTKVNVGDDMGLTCSSKGNPRPKYSWTYNHRPNVEEKTEDGVSRLIILNATRDNAGNYTCQAYNEGGKVSRSVKVTVEGDAASCPIKMSQHRVVVKHGDPVSVNCSTSESNFSGIGWEASRGGTGIRPVNHLLWTVNSLTEWSISPVCFFSQHPGDVCMRELEVIVYRFPETIEISSSSAYSNLMSEGETHNFTCHIPKIAPLQNLTVRWYKGDTVLQTDTLHSDTREPLNSSSVFSFTATKEEHDARFRCEAHMDLGPEGPQFNATSHEFIANVEYGPYIECPTIELREGESLKGKCNVMGNPTPEVTWFKDGQWINLTTPLRRNDGGIYTVKTEGFSSAEETIQVNVLYSAVETTRDVSIRAMFNTNLVVEDRELQLKCDIVSSGPIRVQNLTVWGFRGNDSVKLAESNTSSCEGVSVGLPGNFSCTVNITLKRAHSGLQIRCEAQFEPGEQQFPQNAMSQPLNISVMYQPEINTTKLPDAIPLFRGYPEELVCEADGNPPPNITWIHSSPTAQTGSGGKLSVFDPGLYTCTAENPVNSTTYSVQVFLKEDYLPLIAGFVAVTVVAISVVFLFIYSIYYKNTKMRRYNLKNAKLSTQNGNVAHNGWDMQFPITKLS